MAVLAITNNYQVANDKERTTTEQRWCKPEPRCVKVNVDAAFFIDEGVAATAAIIRDDKGNFLAAQCKYITHNSRCGNS